MDGFYKFIWFILMLFWARKFWSSTTSLARLLMSGCPAKTMGAPGRPGSTPISDTSTFCTLSPSPNSTAPTLKPSGPTAATPGTGQAGKPNDPLGGQSPHHQNAKFCGGRRHRTAGI